MDFEHLKISNQLCFKIYSASRTMIRLYKPILDKLKLTYPQYITMLVMWEKEVIPFKELSNKLKLKTGTLTPIIDKLVKLGYIIKIKDKKDDRKLLVELTDEGRELKAEALKVPSEIACKTSLDKDKYVKYMEMMDDLLGKLNEAEKDKWGE